MKNWIVIAIIFMVAELIFFQIEYKNKQNGGVDAISSAISKRSDEDINERIMFMIAGDYGWGSDMGSYYSLIGEYDKSLPWMRVAASAGDPRIMEHVAEELLRNGLWIDTDMPSASIAEGFAILNLIAKKNPTIFKMLNEYQEKYKTKWNKFPSPYVLNQLTIETITKIELSHINIDKPINHIYTADGFIEKLSNKEVSQQVEIIMSGNYEAAIDLAKYYLLADEHDKYLPWMRVAASAGDIRAMVNVAEELLREGLVMYKPDASIVEGFALLNNALKADSSFFGLVNDYKEKYKAKWPELPPPYVFSPSG